MFVFNVFLYLCFLFSPAQYDEFQAAGATCYGYVPDHGEMPEEAPPVCFYSPAK